jgi:copper chaperone CopZ
MNTRTCSFIVALIGLTVAASAQVKVITMSPGGVLCLSCAHRVEKAIQRLDGVADVKVRMEPVRAEITPRAGAWIEADRLRAAIRNAGFRPGDIVYTVTGRLAEWHGQPAISVAGSDRLVVLEAEPKAPEAFQQVRQARAELGERMVEVEGLLVMPASGGDPNTPGTLRVRRFAVAR